MKTSVVTLALVASFLLLGPLAGVSHAVATPTALLVQDANPWYCGPGGTSADVTAMNDLGIVFNTVSSATFASMNLGQLINYHVIIFAGDQVPSYYTRLSSPVIRTELTVLLAKGVNLVIHAVDNGFCGGFWASPYVFPYTANVAHVQDYDPSDTQAGSGAVLTGVTFPIAGNSANHDYFTNLPAGATVLIQNDLNLPTYFTWQFGRGTVYASTLTLEFYATGGHCGCGGPAYTTILDNELMLANFGHLFV